MNVNSFLEYCQTASYDTLEERSELCFIKKRF